MRFNRIHHLRKHVGPSLISLAQTSQNSCLAVASPCLLTFREHCSEFRKGLDQHWVADSLESVICGTLATHVLGCPHYSSSSSCALTPPGKVGCNRSPSCSVLCSQCCLNSVHVFMLSSDVYHCHLSFFFPSFISFIILSD